MLFGKKDPRLRPADDSFRRLTAMNFAFSGLNAFVCAWAITPPNAPANPELFIGIIIATLIIASTRLYEGDPKRLKVSAEVVDYADVRGRNHFYGHICVQNKSAEKKMKMMTRRKGADDAF